MHVLILVTNKTEGKMKKNIIRMHVLILVTNKTKTLETNETLSKSTLLKVIVNCMLEVPFLL